jgi:hypothetical protein
VYEDRIRAQSRDLALIAAALTRVTRETTGAATELPTHDLGHAVARLAVVLARLADEPPDIEGADDAARVVLGERLSVDAMSVFLFGDQVLDAFAPVELARRGAPGRGWLDLVRVLDTATDDPMTPGVRYLNVALSFVRDLLVEHATVDHYPTMSYGSAGSVTFGRIGPPDQAGEPYVSAARLLHEALGLVPDPHADPMGAYRQLADRAIEVSPWLDADRAGLVRSAFRQAGFHSVPIPWLIEWLVVILREHLRHRRIRCP